MSPELIGQLAGVLGGLAGVAALLGWWSDRRKKAAEAARLNAEAEVAEQSVAANVNLSNVASLQAQLVYLEKIIENIGKHNDKLQSEIEAAEERERKWVARVRELEEEVAQVRKNAAVLQEQCDKLERKLTEMAGESK